jgi:SAM-dependent methyltransferase
MDESTKQARRLSFGSAVDAYEAARPGYPAEAVGWLLAPVGSAGPLTVMDLGAGTGRLSAQLVEAGHRVIAVEPDAGMRERLTANIAAAQVVSGSAERTGVPDGAVDAVLAAQAFHWFDRSAALPEIARVLRHGGVVGLLWNMRDQSRPWTAEYGRLIHYHEVAEAPENSSAADLGPLFDDVEVAEFPYEQELDVEGLVELARSRSYVITLPERQRAELLASIRALPERFGELAGRFALPYTTECYRARVR